MEREGERFLSELLSVNRAHPTTGKRMKNNPTPSEIARSVQLRSLKQPPPLFPIRARSLALFAADRERLVLRLRTHQCLYHGLCAVSRAEQCTQHKQAYDCTHSCTARKAGVDRTNASPENAPAVLIRLASPAKLSDRERVTSCLEPAVACKRVFNCKWRD